jgi:hypothetical protein
LKLLKTPVFKELRHAGHAFHRLDYFLFADAHGELKLLKTPFFGSRMNPLESRASSEVGFQIVYRSTI